MRTSRSGITFTGKMRPADGVRHDHGRTAVDVDFGVYGSALLVCSPGKTDRVHPAEEPAPTPITLEGPFAFRLEPTMDNRWGDFRHPPANVMIGAEARRFRYRDEDAAPGIELGWHEPSFDDRGWTEVTYSHGPYWLEAGPFPDGTQPSDSADWRPYVFSKRHGSAEQSVGWPGAEHLVGVSENFLILDGLTQDEPEHHHYLHTTVRSRRDTSCLFVFGRQRDPDMVSLRAADASRSATASRRRRGYGSTARRSRCRKPPDRRSPRRCGSHLASTRCGCAWRRPC